LVRHELTVVCGIAHQRSLYSPDANSVRTDESIEDMIQRVLEEASMIIRVFQVLSELQN
jgi:hypothetical protein